MGVPGRMEPKILWEERGGVGLTQDGDRLGYLFLVLGSLGSG
jgi:hypothetical protein